MTINGLSVGVSPEKLVGPVGAFGLHTLAVYFVALEVSPGLVGRWFAWFVPVLQISTSTPAADWYMQHLELVSIVPALAAGYIVARRPDSVATWGWGVPALVLAYKMLQYHAPSSVLVGTSMSAIRYFFDIKQVVPMMPSLAAGDPVRVLAQMTVTSPFYAGVAYSLGAWASKQKLLTKLFGSRVP